MMKAKGLTHIGKVRKNNEDCIFVPSQKNSVQNLYIVADGMGGYNAGEVASRVAVESFVKYIRKEQQENEVSDILDLLKRATLIANRAVYNKSVRDKKCSEMGTTLVATAIYNNKIYIAYAGDSRAYLFKKGKLIPLTMDHSLVMELISKGEITEDEAWCHPKRNVITRAIGIAPNVEVDCSVEEILDGDLVMLCTDGLSGMLTDKEMEHILRKSDNLEDRLNRLVDSANEKGGKDNISVILIDIGGRSSCY